MKRLKLFLLTLLMFSSAHSFASITYICTALCVKGSSVKNIMDYDNYSFDAFKSILDRCGNMNGILANKIFSYDSKSSVYRGILAATVKNSCSVVQKY